MESYLFFGGVTVLFILIFTVGRKYLAKLNKAREIKK